MDSEETFTVQMPNMNVRVATSFLSEDMIYGTFIGNV